MGWHVGTCRFLGTWRFPWKGVSVPFIWFITHLSSSTRSFLPCFFNHKSTDVKSVIRELARLRQVVKTSASCFLPLASHRKGVSPLHKIGTNVSILNIIYLHDIQSTPLEKRWCWQNITSGGNIMGCSTFGWSRYSINQINHQSLLDARNGW